MDYKILTLADKDQWNEYLKALPLNQQDIYYTPEYYSFYQNMGDGEAQCFIFEKDGNLAMYPFLINSVNDLGYDLDKQYYDLQGAYGYNGVITSTNDGIFIRDFFITFCKYVNDSNIIADFTRFNPYIKNHKISENFMKIFLNRQTVVLELNRSLDDIWTNSYSSTYRNKIRKARRKGFTLIIDNSVKGATNFYSIYLSTMKAIKANCYYYFNENMFIEISKNPCFYFLFVKDYDDNILSSMILIIYKEYAHYHLGGRDIKKGDNSSYNFMLDGAVEIALNKGAKLFHFGGGNSLDANDSLFRFKKGFSKTYLDFYIGQKIYKQEIYDEIVKQWEIKNPDKIKDYKNVLLKYRY